MTWDVRTGPDTRTMFADIALMTAMDEHGDLGNWLDDRIGYYVGLDDDVDEMIEAYND